MWQINIYILHIPQFFDEIITTQTFTVQLSSRTYHEFDFLILSPMAYMAPYPYPVLTLTLSLPIYNQ